MNRVERADPPARSHSVHWTWLAALSVLGVFVSVGHELHNTPLWNPGVATLTRPLHALLGLLGLLWLVGGLRVYRWFFWAWIVTAVPMIAVDPSQEWTLQLIRLDVHQGSYSSVSFSDGPLLYTNYQTWGINFAPLLVGLWFGWLTRRDVFPLFKSPPGSSEQRRARVWALWWQVGVFGCLGAFFAWCGWLRMAPMVIVAAEPGLSFYYKDERLGSGYLRVTPALLEKMGLDSSRPSEEWTVHTGYGRAWGQGLFIDDGQDQAWVQLAMDWSNPYVLTMESPWGPRVAAARHTQSMERRWLIPYLAKVNRTFDVRLEPISRTVVAGSRHPVKVSVQAHGKVPRFKQLFFSAVHLEYQMAEGEFPRRTREEWRVWVPPESALMGLKTLSSAETVLDVPAPHRPGTYALMLQGWFRDAEGRQIAGRPTSLGYSHSALVTVVPAKDSDSSGDGEAALSRVSASANAH